ncbi:uncharacterized protein [Malus domestica]|uniref:uncharacterized protein n=1 Tax=Malus domestica TaxID=3750 RepID=UPI0007ED5AD2|nr:uncharacterized protein LOC108172971 [Malus domestica]
MAATTVSVTRNKWPRPEIGVVGATVLSVFLPPPVVDVSVKGPQDHSMDQPTEVHPTIPVVVEPVVVPLVEGPAIPRSVVTLVVGPVAAIVRKVATLAEKNPSPSPKKKPIIVVEEEPSWEVELDALLSSTSRVAGPFVASTEPSAIATESNVSAKLQELLSFSASQVL